MESKKKEKLPIRIRPAADMDVSFIFSSWLKSYRATAFTRNITNTVYYTEHHKVIEDILKTSTVYVACNEKEPEDIYGYVVAEKIDNIFVLHYIYVKHTYRMFGLGKLLLQQFEHESGQAGICTHMTRLAERLAAKYNLIYSPYLALTKEYRKKAEANIPEAIKGAKNESSE
jgi:L-amino acid N-acyltransferase YncA